MRLNPAAGRASDPRSFNNANGFRVWHLLMGRGIRLGYACDRAEFTSRPAAQARYSAGRQSPSARAWETVGAHRGAASRCSRPDRSLEYAGWRWAGWLWPRGPQYDRLGRTTIQTPEVLEWGTIHPARNKRSGHHEVLPSRRSKNLSSAVSVANCANSERGHLSLRI